jgi:hypothetical protein
MKSVPCAGCGEVHEGYGRAPWTAKRPICPKCRIILEKHYPRLKAEVERMADHEAYFVPECNSPLPFCGMDDDSTQKLEKAIMEFLAVFPAISPDKAGYMRAKPLWGGVQYNWSKGFFVQMPRKQAEAVMRMIKGLHEYAEDCLKYGHKKGSDLLGQLMSGEMTCEQVNEAMLENKG